MNTPRPPLDASPAAIAQYRDCYTNVEREEKRRITAKDSLEHVRAMLGSTLGRTVDVGAGNGALLEELYRSQMASSLSALEISDSGIECVRRRKIPLDRLEHFDGYSMPFHDDEFDTALSVHVIEHAEHERALLREMGRIARRLYIEVPLEAGLRGRINREFGHINYYVPRTFLNLVETSGLRVIRWRVLTHSFAYERHIYGAAAGALRNGARRTILNLLGPSLASELMTFLMGVTAESA